MAFRNYPKKVLSKACLIFTLSIASMLVSCSKESTQIIPNKEVAISLFKEKLVLVSANLTKVSPSIKEKISFSNEALPQHEIKVLMAPLVEQAKVLLLAYGLYDGVRAEFGDNDQNILIAGFILMDYENKKSISMMKSNSAKKANSIEANMVDDIDADELSDCLIEAFGLGGASIAGLNTSGKIVAKKLAQLALKLAAKTVSWIGLAFTAYQLTNCLVEADLN